MSKARPTKSRTRVRKSKGPAPEPKIPAAAASLSQPYYLAKIRHELRTPINHIIGYSEMLQEDAQSLVSPSFLADLQKIHTGGQQLLSLINEYFADEKFESTKRDLRDGGHKLRTPVTHILGYSEMLQEQAEELGRKDFVADLQKIHTAATNWLALMEEHLFASCQASEIQSGQAQTPADAPAKPGPDLNTSFRPLATSIDGYSHSEQGTLLVVDDDENNRDMLVRRLRRQGYTVASAESGRKGLKMLRGGKYDLVLLDMIMPGIDGYQLLEKIKAAEALRHIPVIMISALDQVDGIVRCIEIGAEDYLFKPFNPVFLRARIGAALEKKRLRDKEQVYLQQIKEEREKSERLLLNVLPQAVAERLKKGDQSIVDSYPEATVVFADLVGFTSLSIHIKPTEVVHLLNEVFSAFDLLAAKHGLEKIKTIGDAYMAAAGLPVPRKDHTEAAAEFALDVQNEVNQFNVGYRTSLRMRIGMNTGPVIAGIIGRNKFIYDLWGDTVNTASRMESHGVPRCIHVTAATFEVLKDKYRFEKRGNIEIKGKGNMVTYFLIGRGA